MRCQILLFAAVFIALPASCQRADPGPSNVAGDLAMRNAIRGFDPNVSARMLPEKPAQACAVRLIEVPVSKDTDKGMVHRLNPDSDSGMVVRAPLPACPKDGEQARR